MSEYTAKALIEPRDYRVVFVIQKKAMPFWAQPDALKYEKYKKTLLTTLFRLENSSSVRFLCCRNIILFKGFCN